MIVVVVLMTSCHVSENPKMGPEKAHSTIAKKASIKAQGEPTIDEVLLENLRKASFILCTLVQRQAACLHITLR